MNTNWKPIPFAERNCWATFHLMSYVGTSSEGVPPRLTIEVDAVRGFGASIHLDGSEELVVALREAADSLAHMLLEEKVRKQIVSELALRMAIQEEVTDLNPLGIDIGDTICGTEVNAISTGDKGQPQYHTASGDIWEDGEFNADEYQKLGA